MRRPDAKRRPAGDFTPSAGSGVEVNSAAGVASLRGNGHETARVPTLSAGSAASADPRTIAAVHPLVTRENASYRVLTAPARERASACAGSGPASRSITPAVAPPWTAQFLDRGGGSRGAHKTASAVIQKGAL